MQPRHVAWLLAVVPLLVALWPGAGAGHHPQAPDDLPSEVAFVWFDQLYDLVKAEQITPPPASRIYGLAAVTLYEAWCPAAGTHRPLAGQLNGSPADPLRPPRHRRYHWPTVANSACSTGHGREQRLACVVRRPPRPSRDGDDRPVEQAFAAEVRARVRRRSIPAPWCRGRAVAEAVLAWAATDGRRGAPRLPLHAARGARPLGTDAPRLRAAPGALLGPAAPPGVGLR